MESVNLNQKFDMLAGFELLSENSAELQRIKSIIMAADDWQLFRINPLAFAGRHQFSERFIIDFFVHASKIGLFDFQWNIICPGCGGVEYSHTSIGDIRNRLYHCTICNVGVSSEIDDQVEVAFTLSNSIRKLKINSFESFGSYINFFFSENYQPSQPMQEYTRKHYIDFKAITPDEICTFQITAKSGEFFRFISMHSHSQVSINIDDKPVDDSQVIAIGLDSNGFLTKELKLAPGLVTVKIQNLTRTMNAANLMRVDYPVLAGIVEQHPNIKKRFFTAKMLLNNQSFKDLFKAHELPKDFNLNVRSLTILFTDLKGSTQLYEKSGDLAAFHVVQEHFDILFNVVRKNSGAVIKTMGDAIMAAFSVPDDAVRAALEMLGSTTHFWRDHQVPEMGLKVGVHEGPALAIAGDDRLDYFGQTVNVAARVQGQANAGDLVLSESVFRNIGVQEVVAGQSRRGEREMVTLRGIDHPVGIYRFGQP